MNALTTLRIEITDRCPLACTHCSVLAGPKKTTRIDPPDAIKLIEQFAAQGGRELVVTGGEPLTHPDCGTILQSAKELGLRTTIFSMGVIDGVKVISRNDALQLARALDLWRVSIHASEATGHEALTMIPGSFDATCKAVSVIRGAGITVCATFFAHPGNITDLSEVARLCDSLGIGDLRVLSVIPQGRAVSKPERFAVLSEQIDEAILEANRFSRVHVRLGEAARARKGEASECRAIQDELVVSCDGWISPCHSVEPTASSSALDNVLRTPLSRVLRDSPRLLSCRQREASHPGGCSGGCLARLALVGAS